MKIYRLPYLLSVMTSLKRRHPDWDAEACKDDAIYIIENLERVDALIEEGFGVQHLTVETD